MPAASRKRNIQVTGPTEPEPDAKRCCDSYLNILADAAEKEQQRLEAGEAFIRDHVNEEILGACPNFNTGKVMVALAIGSGK